MNILQQYIEYIIIENFIVNFFILLFINIFAKEKVKILRIIITTIISTFYSSIVNIYSDYLNTIFSKLLLSVICVFIAFNPKNISKYIKLSCYYYLIYFEFIGVIISLTLIFNINIESIIIRLIIYIITIVIVYLFNKFMWKMWKIDIKKRDLSVKICINEIEINGIVDTGNSATGNNGLPVIFVNNKFKEKIIIDENCNSIDFVNIKTINKENFIKSYMLENVYIYKGGKKYKLKNVNIAFSDMLTNNYYDAIVGYDIYIDNLEGSYL